MAIGKFFLLVIITPANIAYLRVPSLLVMMAFVDLDTYSSFIIILVLFFGNGR